MISAAAGRRGGYDVGMVEQHEQNLHNNMLILD